MCIKNTHFKCLKSYYRISRVEVTHECIYQKICYVCKKTATYTKMSSKLTEILCVTILTYELSKCNIFLFFAKKETRKKENS